MREQISILRQEMEKNGIDWYMVTTADYHMEAHIAVQHASVAVLKDKSATLLVTYDIHFPASDEYMMETKGAKVK